jgi:hypothetical protein
VHDADDHFSDVQTDVVPIHVSIGAYNSTQQSDAHAYWEFNYQGTIWVYPLYELPFSGGFPDDFGKSSRRLLGRRGRQAAVDRSRPGLSDERNKPQDVGEHPTFRAIPPSFTPAPVLMLDANSAKRGSERSRQ